MKLIKDISKFSILILLLVCSCKSHVASKEVDEFAIFTTTEIFDSLSGYNRMDPSVDQLIRIARNQPLEKKISTLLDSISYIKFNNLKIEVLSINETPQGTKSLIVNLKENPGFIIPDSLGKYHSWYEFFQGSMGGEQTTIILIESILQREFTGDWIDEVEFNYQNEQIGERDHVFLSGKIKRN